MVNVMSLTEHTNLWNAEVKIPRRGNFNCNCFLKRDIWPACDILWRPRIEVSLSVHLPGKQCSKSLVRDPWIKFYWRSPPAHISGSWMAERWLTLQHFVSISARDGSSDLTDEMKIVKCCKSDSPESKLDREVKDKYFVKGKYTALQKVSESRGTHLESDLPVEEPWLVGSSALSWHTGYPNSSNGLTGENMILKGLSSEFLESKPSNQLLSNTASLLNDVICASHKSCDSSENLSERVYPVEEPWIFQPSACLPCSDDKMVLDVSKDEGTITDETVQSEGCKEKVPEQLLVDANNCVVSQEDPVSTVILINSSICTMQRIAVLEDGQLVELLLQPVKNNVQCDSVYLGIITKLVPHMGGAFVNIGSSRLSLMDIRPNRQPFIFPPFRRHTKAKDSGRSVSENAKDSDAIENDANSDDDDYDAEVAGEIEEHEIGDDLAQYMHDHYEEHEDEDDSDIPEILQASVNGSLVGDKVEAYFERNSDQIESSVHHLDGHFFKKEPLAEGACACSSQPSHVQKNLDDVKDDSTQETNWSSVRKGTKIIVQVVKEGLGSKGPTLTAYPKLRSRFWILIARCTTIGISKKISGVERTRLRVIAKTLQPTGFGLTVRTVAAGHSLEELQKDLEGLLSTWKVIMEHAKSTALAADEGVEGAIPALLHRAMGQTLSVVQDYFNNKVKSMVVDSPRTYHEVTNYLQEIAPDLCDRVELYSKRTPLFDEYNIEEEINNILSKRVPLAKGGSLVIEQTEALVSIDVNGGQCMLGQGNSQEKAILDVNLAAARQIARELRLRDIGGIIVVDFIDMVDDSNKRLVYEEVKKAVDRDRSMVKVSELSRHGLMEITRKRVRPSVTFMISEPCTCCNGTGRVEALETSFSKIEHEICRLLALMDKKADPENPKSWPRFILRVDRFMCNYFTSGKRTRLAVLSSSLKVWILLKVARGFTRGAFELKPLTEGRDNNSNITRHQVSISVLRPTDVGACSPSRKVTVFPVKKWKTGGK